MERTFGRRRSLRIHKENQFFTLRHQLRRRPEGRISITETGVKGLCGRGAEALARTALLRVKKHEGKRKVLTMEYKTLEVMRPRGAHREFRYAVFDFDGTLSLIREGWQGIMIPYFASELAAAPGAAAEPMRISTKRQRNSSS